jgi:ferrochelatase
MVKVILINFPTPSNEEDAKTILRNMMFSKYILPQTKFIRYIISRIISLCSYKKSWKKYQQIPKSEIKELSLAIKKTLEKKGINILNYYLFSGQSLKEIVEDEIKNGNDELLLVPLFPHKNYCTNGEIIEVQELFQDKIEVLDNWCERDEFVNYWTQLIKPTIAKESEVEKPFIIFSAHSIPQFFEEKMSPKYSELLINSATKIANKLDCDFDVAFQSANGKGKWLEPNLETLITKYYKEMKHILIVPYSFFCENLETYYDLDLKLKTELNSTHPTINIERTKFDNSITTNFILNAISSRVMNNLY